MPKTIHAYWNGGTYRKILELRRGESITVRFRYKEGYPITKLKLRCESREEDLK